MGYLDGQNDFFERKLTNQIKKKRMNYMHVARKFTAQRLLTIVRTYMNYEEAK